MHGSLASIYKKKTQEFSKKKKEKKRTIVWNFI